jgi:carboxymethylenebutenolidase
LHDMDTLQVPKARAEKYATMRATCATKGPGKKTTAMSYPIRLSGPDVQPPVCGILEVPRRLGPRPGVILLPGSSGWQDEYAEIARTLADSGLVALAIDYFVATGRADSEEARLRLWPLWQASVRNAAAYLQASTFVSGRPIALVGYSLGAFLAVSVASSIPGLSAVVEFFGGGHAETLEHDVRHFPALLILHGEADSVVPVASAYRLREAVVAEGGHVEMHVYPGAEHAFNAPWSAMYSAHEAADSLERTIDFLNRHLGESPPRSEQAPTA